MKKSTRRRPGLESLETVVLMSTVSAEVHHAAKAVATVTPIASDGSTQLLGTFSLQSHKLPSGHGLPGGTVLTGSGNLNGLYKSVVLVRVQSAPGSSQGFVVAIDKQSIGLYSAPLSIPARGASISVPYSAIDSDGAEINGNEFASTGTVTLSDLAGKTGKDHYVLKLS